MHPIIPYVLPAVGCLLSCTLYAAALSTRTGAQWAIQKTHYTVIVGVAIVLAWIAVVSIEAALIALVFFVLGGIPIVIRSELLDMKQRESITRKAMGE